jgi:hypothetical protein
LGQNLWRKVQKYDLAAAYQSDEGVRIYVKMLLALSFIPIVDVPFAFDELVENCPPELTPSTDYWEDNYIGRQRRGKRSQPRFNADIWNVRDRVQNNLPRTNNSVEAWHNAFQSTVECHHPSVYKLIEQFRHEQDHCELRIERFQIGFRNLHSSKSQ